MKDKLIEAFNLLKQTFEEWNTDKAPQLAASLAFYTMFSIAPLLIIAIAVAGAIFGEEAAKNQVAAQTSQLLGQQGAEFLQSMVENANKSSSSGIVATLLGVVTLVLGAAGVFNQIKEMLKTIWEVPPKPGKPGIAGVISAIREQFFSISMVLAVGFLLLVSLLISAVLAGVTTFIGGNTGLGAAVLQVLTQVVSFAVITGVFAAMFKYIPGLPIAWRDVLIGAAITALLFTIGKFGLGIYLGQSSTTSSYGAAGSLVLVLLWIYYTAQILFFGAEFTQVYSRKHGSFSHQAAPAATPVSTPATPFPFSKSRALMVVPQPVRSSSQSQTAHSEGSTGREILWVLTAPLLFVGVLFGRLRRHNR